MLKCLQLDITGNTANFIHQFLQNRTFQVRWRNSLSSTKNVQKGIPQGSALSQFPLFAICRTSSKLLTKECSIFAGDIFIFCPHNSLDYAIRKLQNTLVNIHKWCCYWKLKISPEKCFIAELSKRKLHVQPRVTYAGFPLPWEESIK
ncbi:hypothetical protein AVEN_212037-1 [Araneus ventricosus]|uniref:Reverse transcriptase domain-containing protein n=1 Tax=Araneus ventricosus TaxID=182803 RepID=A0A4Y2H656_ARAVE|nr:hypothetical protein AVEN_212037-1 [Araneus ventricosus]